ncbi:MAG: molybdenum cofactor biosynthesis protein MoaE [Verrucomicrobiota bacterium]
MKDFHREITISSDPVRLPENLHNAATGAVSQFLGVVREMENDAPIDGIDYEAYLPMAERQLRRIAMEATEEFGLHPLHIHHRTGFVAAGEPSIGLAVALPHSREAFDLCQYYLQRIKTEVPVWKNIVFRR